MASRLRQYQSSEIVPEYIDVRLISPSPLNFRRKLAGLESLIDSIRRNGLLQPIVVRIADHGFEVVAGHRRLAACRTLRWVRIPCLVKELTEQQAYEVGLVENVERESLTPLEEAKAFRRYVQERGWGSAKELAEKISRSEEYVSHRMALLTLPKTALDLIESDKISSSAAHELVWIKDPTIQGSLARAIAGRSVPAKRVREAVWLARRGAEMEEILHWVEEPRTSWAGPEYKGEKRTLSSRLLEKSVLSLKICVVRLDSIIEELDAAGSDAALRQVLLQKRLLIHDQIDELLLLKKSWG